MGNFLFSSKCNNKRVIFKIFKKLYWYITKHEWLSLPEIVIVPTNLNLIQNSFITVICLNNYLFTIILRYLYYFIFFATLDYSSFPKNTSHIYIHTYMYVCTQWQFTRREEYRN